MSRFNAGKRNLVHTADCLATALRLDTSTPDGSAGALALADALDCLRVVRQFLTAKPKGRGGR